MQFGQNWHRALTADYDLAKLKRDHLVEELRRVERARAGKAHTDGFVTIGAVEIGVDRASEPAHDAVVRASVRLASGSMWLGRIEEGLPLPVEEIFPSQME
jgi:hypothetical protein